MTLYLIFLTVLTGSILPFVGYFLWVINTSAAGIGYKAFFSALFLFDLLVLLYMFVGSILVLSGAIR